MDGSTKILTVSYGTFSCTLEGFDDPLGAMRDIAEYFRDLAADDRYFGAEPPTPDVEMLQSIAEKEVNRRVEARMSETGVALRVEHEKAPVKVTSVEASQVDDLAEDDAAEDAGAIAARVVTAARAAEPEKTKAIRDEDTPDTGTGPLTFDDDFLMADEPEDVLAVDPSARVASEGPAESVAEKLRRIRAVVSRNIEAQEETPAMAAEAEAKRDRALTETIEQITADISDDEDDEQPEQPTDFADETDGVDADAEDIGAAGEENVIEEAAPVEGAARDTSQPLWVRDDEEDEASSEDDLLGDEPDLTAASDDEDDGFDAAQSLFADDAKPVDEVEIAGAGIDETEEDEEEVERRISDIIGNVAGRIDEAAQAEDDALEDDVEVESLSPPPEARTTDKYVLNKPLADDKDDDVGRILAETDTKLKEDDVVRRRRVISQMRAAVAATKADRLVSRQVPRETLEEEERSAYRNDLSRVVRRATTVSPDNDRPKPSSPPLVLVSSQRVDEDEADDVSRASDMPQDFADFAETMGAKELPELLEAAAAYTVFGEGQSSFTRPEIMKRVAAVDPTIRMSREESLRSFGQLLRQGKFRKLERGQFTIDQDTRFNPKHRIAGE